MQRNWVSLFYLHQKYSSAGCLHYYCTNSFCSMNIAVKTNLKWTMKMYILDFECSGQSFVKHYG